MTQLLDLQITLTPPPADAPAGAIAAIALRCDGALGLSHTGGWLSDPITPAERKELDWYLEDYWKWPYEEFAERGRRVEQSLEAAGRRLYDALCASREATRLIDAWHNAEGAHQISILSDVPQALGLPWELLHDEQGFLALRTRQPVSILRRLPQSQAGSNTTGFQLPLRVLLVTARPDDAGFVDPRGIARELLDEVQPQIEAGLVALEFLRPPTRAALRERLGQEPPVHILHFDGHGTFAEGGAPDDGLRLGGGGQGALAFEKDDGKLDLVPAAELAQMLQDSGVRLAVLTACQSAKGAAEDLFSSVAARLIRSGVDAVVAMSASVLVASAARYVEAFYRRLAAGEAVTLAHERARQALHDQPERHLHQRRRDEAGAPIRLKDWWLPHFYQQRALNFASFVVPPLGGRDVAAKPLPPEGGTTNTDLPPAPRYGFTGRAQELHQLERWLMRGKAVVVHGFGGVGKTTLAREAAAWLTATGMYDQFCFVSFEHGGDASVLLGALGHRLNVYAGDYDPRDVAAALNRLRPALRARRTLVIADNLESILPGGEAPLAAEARGQLWGVLLGLAQAGAGVLVTSRDANFGDGRMAHGPEVKHLALGGLHAEDAYALASRLLAELDIAQARAPYRELRDLLVQLDHHPLAIQLVLPALGDESLTLARISHDFAALLPRFVDDRETGRNRSLLASFEYSLRRLSDEQKQLLVRLALFESGVSEDDLLAITEISEGAWAILRSALEQAALLAPKKIGDFTAPFFRFHPVLSPFLRTQPGANDVRLQARFSARYRAVAEYLYREDKRSPLPIRELARNEMPNLRRALGRLISEGELDEATHLSTFIAYFLNIAGLWRECDDIRRQLEDALARSGDQAGELLTHEEFLRVINLGEDKYYRGDLQSANAQFTKILNRIVTQPIGAAHGRGSYEHCVTLCMLARCLVREARLGAAVPHLREALSVIDALISEQPDDQLLTRQRYLLLAELGEVLLLQGNYNQAQAVYEQSLNGAEQQGDIRCQGVILGQLGTLALRKRNYDEARERYTQTLAIFHHLGEPLGQAAYLHQLGMVALNQNQWAEAERYSRESLAIKEQQGDLVGAISTYNQLALIAADSGRPDEAEGWLKRALKHPDLPTAGEALLRNNLADLLKNEVRAGRLPKERLAEARAYAEEALMMMNATDASSEIWLPFKNLADITEIEGQPEIAQAYRRREREAYAAFAGHRHNIDADFNNLLDDIAAASRGDEQVKTAVNNFLPKLEAEGWHITSAIHRIWAGERDWHALAEDLNRAEALLVLRVLETMAEQQ